MTNSRREGQRGRRGVRRTGAYFAFVLPASLPFVLAMVDVGAPINESARLLTRPQVRYSELVAAAEPAALPEHSVMLTIEQDDTLASLLADGGLDRADCARVTREVARSIDLRTLRPGDLVRLHYGTTGRVDSVELKITGWGEVDIVRDGNEFSATAHQAQEHDIQSTV